MAHLESNRGKPRRLERILGGRFTPGLRLDAEPGISP